MVKIYLRKNFQSSFFAFCTLLFVFCILAVPVANAQKITVTGVVISSEDNQPIIGADILEKSTSNGTITDRKSVV